MAGEWTTVRVQDIAVRTATGPFGSAISSKHFLDSGVPVIRGSNLSQVVSTRLDDNGLVFVSEEKAKEFKRSEVRRGDLVFTCWGTIDQVGIIDARAKHDRYIVSNKQMLLTPDSTRADSLFLYYYFASSEVRAQIINEGIGSSVPGFNLGQLRSFEIPLPPLAEQKAIAAMLGALDDKIELNRRMNATLEAMARALFQSWFVDFDPVRAKLDARQPPGLDEATVALFPATFQDSTLGPIPRGWEVCPLSEKIQLLSGGTPKTSEPTYWDGDIPWYSVRDAPTETDVWVIHTDKTVTKLGIANSAAQILPEKTTIISARGTVGKLALTAVPMAMNQSCYGVRGITGYGDYFTYYLLREATAQLQQRTHGTVFDTITTETFESLDCIFPTLEITATFEKRVEPLLGRMRANLHQSRTLATLRDALLPKLLSGELLIST